MQTDRHPVFVEYEDQWSKVRAAFLGGRAWYGSGDTFQVSGIPIRSSTPGKEGHSEISMKESRYLWRHPREKDWKYNIRLRAAVYENVYRPFVMTQAAAVSRAAKRVELPDALTYLESDVDRWHMDAAMFRLQRIAWAHVYGHIFVLFDKPQGARQPSRLHELAAGIRTYMQLLSPLDVLDWQWDAERQEFLWALVTEYRSAERLAPDVTSSVNSADRVTWTRLIKPGEWVRYRNGKEFERGRTGVDFVPITVQFGLGQNPEVGEPLGIDISSDVADKAIEMHNKESWLTEQEMHQCFNQAMIKAPNLSQEELESAIGTCTYVPADDFRWVAPDVGPMDHLAASLGRDVSAMRQMMGVETKGEQSQAAKSGLALQIEQQNVSNIFAGYAAAAEAGERTMWRTAAIMEGVNPDDVVVEYAKDFSAMDAQARFDMIVQALTSGDFGGKAKAELQKQMFMAACPDLENEELAAIFDDIDESADESLEPAVDVTMREAGHEFGVSEQTEAPEPAPNPFAKPPAGPPDEKEPPPFKPPQGEPEGKGV